MYCSRLYSPLATLEDCYISLAGVCRSLRVMNPVMQQSLRLRVNNATGRSGAACHVSNLNAVSTIRPHSTATQLPARTLDDYSRVASRLQPCRAPLTTLARATPEPVARTAREATPKGPSAVQGRQMLLERNSAESFKIAGVSFEGRQALVSAMQPGRSDCEQWCY